MFTPRLRAVILRGLGMAVVFFVVQLLLALIPGRAPLDYAERGFVSLGVGAIWGFFVWLRWPAEQRRRSQAPGPEPGQGS
ncbi:MAG: hypothetical protein Q4P32_00965 [Micrococcales bacterium]|nr:hypothetical protein [Micrococcales bacterium]